MSITDELRKWAMDNSTNRVLTSYPPKHEVFGTREALLDIADRIDAEYQKAIRELNDLASASVLLPLDADGIRIRIGDMIAYKGNTEPKRVVALVPPSVVMVEDGPRYAARYADMCRHYTEPTVEDVMVEFATDWECTEDVEDKAALLKEYAARLRLAKEGE